MTHTPVSRLSYIHLAEQIALDCAREDVDTQLERWINDCFYEGVHDLDTMIVTAPTVLKSKFACYDSMADAVEMTVRRVWTEIAARRLLAA